MCIKFRLLFLKSNSRNSYRNHNNVCNKMKSNYLEQFVNRWFLINSLTNIRFGRAGFLAATINLMHLIRFSLKFFNDDILRGFIVEIPIDVGRYRNIRTIEWTVEVRKYCLEQHIYASRAPMSPNYGSYEPKQTDETTNNIVNQFTRMDTQFSHQIACKKNNRQFIPLIAL